LITGCLYDHIGRERTPCAGFLSDGKEIVAGAVPVIFECRAQRKSAVSIAIQTGTI
jgi:hypothetical protein